MKESHIYYEVKMSKKLGGGINTFYDLCDAVEYLKDMKKGFPKKHPNMNDMDRAYWKKIGKKSAIFKVVQTTTQVLIKK